MQKRILHQRRGASKRSKVALVAVALLVMFYFLTVALLRPRDQAQVWLEVRDINDFFSWEKSWFIDPAATAAEPKEQQQQQQGDAMCVLSSDGSVRFRPGKEKEDSAFYMNAMECRATLARVIHPLKSNHTTETAVSFPAQPISCDGGQPCPLLSFTKKRMSEQNPKPVYELSIPMWRRATLPTSPSPSPSPSPAPPPSGATPQTMAVVPPPSPHCPTSYVTVQLQGFGRMQNQMQAVVNAMLWSQHLGRTFVLPPLCWNITCCWNLACHSRLDMEHFYDFSLWRAAGLCVINYDAFLTASGTTSEAGAEALKQLRFYYGPRDEKAQHPLLSIDTVRLDDFMTQGEADSKTRQNQHEGGRARYNVTREGSPEPATHQLKGEAARNRREEWLVLSAATAFFLRFPLVATQQLFGLLRPSPRVQEQARAVLASSPHGFATVGFHLRSREGTCRYEAVNLPSKLGPSDTSSPHSISMSKTFTDAVLWECVPHVYDVLSRVTYTAEALQLNSRKKSTVPKIDGASVYHGLSLLIATDQQSQDVLREARDKWEHLYPGWFFRNLAVARKEGELEQLACDVAVDFFVLTAVDVFWGNRFSSVSQNVCMWRLYNGKSCHGFAGGMLPLNFQDV